MATTLYKLVKRDTNSVTSFLTQEIVIYII